MDLKQLKYFSAIVRMGSFRKAAEAVHISQPALSLAIKGLETELDVKLLERGPGKLVTTAYGKALFKHAQIIDANVQQALGEINQLRGVGEGTVSIAISPFVSGNEMGSLIGQFIDRYPNIHLRTDHSIYEWSMQRLSKGEIDFFFSEVPEQPDETEATHHLLFRMPYRLLCGRQHPLAKKKFLSLKQVLEFRLAYGRDWANNIHGWKQSFDKEGRRQPESFIEVGPSEFFLSLLQDSDAIVLNPLTGLMQQYIDQREVVELNVQGGDWYRSVALVHRRKQAFTPAAQLLFDEIRDNITRLSNREPLI